MRIAVAVVVVAACRGGSSPEPSPAIPPPTIAVPATMPIDALVAEPVVTPRDTEPPPRPFGQLAGETVLGVVRMQQGPTIHLSFRGANELWALSWDSVVASTHPKQAIDGSNGLWIWDPTTREVKRRVDRPIHEFAIAEKANLIATVDRNSDRVALLDATTFRERWSIEWQQPSDVAITPDGATIIVGDQLGKVSALDARDGRILWVDPAHSGYVTSVVVSPSGKYVASAGADVEVIVRDTATHATVATIRHQTRTLLNGEKAIDGVNALVFSPDESAIASAGWDQLVHVNELPSGAQRLAIHAKQDIDSLAWSPDGTWIASGTEAHQVQLWRAKDGSAGKLIEGHGAPVKALAFSPDSKQLASGAMALGSRDFSIRLWDVASGAEVGASGGHGDEVRVIDVASNGASMITIGADRRVIEWDLATKSERGNFVERYYHTQYAYTADAKLVAHGGDEADIVVLRVPSGALYAKIATGDADVEELALTRDGARLAAIVDDKLVIYALPSGKRVRSIAIGEVTTQIGFCDRGAAVWYKALAGIVVVDVASGKERARLASVQPGEIDQVAMSPDCKRALNTTWNQPALGFVARDLTTKRVLFTVPNASKPQFSLDGKHIVALDGPEVLSIDANGTIVKRYPGHATTVSALAILPDGHVVSGGTDALVKIWP